MNRLLSFLIVTAFASQIVTVVLAKPIFAYFVPLVFSEGVNRKEEFKNQVFKLEFTKDFPKNDDDVRFNCTNNLRPKEFVEVKLNDPEVKNKLDFSKPINFVIHGFMANIDPLKKMANDWASNADCNVCVVDWRPLSGYSIDGLKSFFENVENFGKYEEIAVTHTVTTSNSIHRFMEFLMKNEMDIKKVSIAGHSLGAHIAGFVGASFNGTIKAIYGLDPAGPGFQEAPVKNKLNKHDAQYVQCIYTDGNSWGTKTTSGDGHENFFMNREGEDQPGCTLAMCDHSRAYEYFIESLNENAKFEGEECHTEDNQKRTDWIGIHSRKIHSNFCVFTDDKPPYALGELKRESSMG